MVGEIANFEDIDHHFNLKPFCRNRAWHILVTSVQQHQPKNNKDYW